MPLKYAAAGAIGLGLLGAWPPVNAAGADDAIRICRQIEDPSGRLACYDRIGRADPSVPAASQAARNAPPKPEPLHQKVLDARRAPDGKLIVSLDNGQVWHQLDTDRADIRPGDDITIRPGALGSYLLVGPRDRNAIRVRWDR